MAIGLGLLRIEPRAFWAMTLQELQAALRSIGGGYSTATPPSRGVVQSLMQRFPDEELS